MAFGPSPPAMASTPWAGAVLANEVSFQASAYLCKHLPDAGPGSQREWKIAVIRPAKRNVQNCHSDSLVVKKQASTSSWQQENGLTTTSPSWLVKTISKLTFSCSTAATQLCSKFPHHLHLLYGSADRAVLMHANLISKLNVKCTLNALQPVMKT